MARIVVVGSGIAGLVTALVASRRHEVVLVTKGMLAESSTRAAQGGIAAVTAPSDSVALHVEDTLTAGAGLAVREAVEVLCAEGPTAVAALQEWGVAFDREGEELARGLEGAHSRPRILHAGGDATGAAIEEALVAAVRDASGSVEVREQTALVDLVLSGDIVTGAEVLHAGRVERLTADAVVLATGGAGQLYRHTTNPTVSTGDGLAAALRAGAEVADLEFYQFHPTTLALPGGFLVSEAVRGEGAVLRDAAGERFLLGLHPDAELAPRDVVARAIADRMRLQGGLPVHLDARALAPDVLARRFPTISAVCRANGLSLADDLLPVTPAAHYWMGGIATDLDGRTSLPGLLAVGEVARTGVHGANRLASNSLLEGVVFARRAATALDMLTREAALARATPKEARRGGIRGGSRHRVAPVALDRRELQEQMWAGAGLSRDAAGLVGLRDALTASATPAPLDLRTLEDANLLACGLALVDAALARTSSRGAHYRSDASDHPSASAARATDSRKAALQC
ncbi:MULTISPECIES: L-aspartate oxidase [unclassified Rathayibacter]|uniref:L-aspartate oxidase n=1 Tax=unclassified Rathayibacter TaxID=2609250 RepID=UPI00188A416C|nr:MULTISPECIES: L-aspartate oxidase [unclassified Rathayibacter]MBF4463468.1 L-aspartate oxidase [Rathayibacter sp. VKM Ac-2879]MBF4504810.1 L-aspartate oxidase [Rathayibacter sp. VKM Ac-2878]